MSNASISRIGLPRLPDMRFNGDLARGLLLRVLSNIRTGSLTLHDGMQTYRFGHPESPDQPHAEINVHDPDAYRAWNDQLGERTACPSLIIICLDSSGLPMR